MCSLNHIAVEIIVCENGASYGCNAYCFSFNAELIDNLSNKTVEFIAARLYETQDYVLRFESTAVNGKKLCCNTLFIKDSRQQLVGLLCINFDSSRYEELSARVLDLCGGALTPGIPSGINLITGSDDPVLDEPDRDYPSSIAGATASIVSSVVANYPVPVDRLTQNEKLEIMELLNRKGVFLLKGSVSYVAKELHSSEASIYRYLGKINNKAE